MKPTVIPKTSVGQNPGGRGIYSGAQADEQRIFYQGC